MLNKIAVFKSHWDITKNWHFLFPFIGFMGLFFSSYKIAAIFKNKIHISLIILLAIVIAFILLKITLWLFKKLEHKWKVSQRWHLIRIFIVFAITGSTSAYIGKPFITFLGISKENLNVFFYYLLYVIISLVFYQVLLVTIGWLLGQGKFFWEFEKKMLNRFGLGKFLKL